MSKSALRQAGLPGYELGDYIDEAISFLREHEPAEGYFVGFSGGKDSIVALALCELAGVRHRAFFSCTRIDPPEMLRFIKREYPQVTWLYPQKSFWRLIRVKQPPTPRVRWCCDLLKKRPARDIPLKMRVMGIRAEESTKRASYPRLNKYNGKQTMVKPIFHWPEWAVWEFIEAKKLAYPILYDQGFSRIGCMVCPFILGNSPGQIATRHRSMARWPQAWKVFEKVVRDWFSTKCKRRGSESADQFWDRYINGERKE